MSAQRGLEPFDPETEDVDSYLERLEQYFLVKDVKEEQKVAHFLTMVGSSAYQVLRDLVAPVATTAKTLKELTDVLKKHYRPTRLVIAERFIFHRRYQQPGEDAARYMAELWRLAKTCQFGTFLKEALRDQFVCGLSAVNIQKRLLSEADLTVERSLELSQAMDAAERGAKNFKEDQQENLQQGLEKAAVCTIEKSSRQCSRCARKGHSPGDCPHRDAQCYGCKKTGHLAQACRLAKTDGKFRTVTKQHVTHQVEETAVDSGEKYYLDYIGEVKGDTKRLWIEVELNGIPLKMELDTGISISLVSKRTWQDKLGAPPLNQRKLVLRTYSGQTLHVLGEATVQVKTHSQLKQLPLVVVEEEGTPLFGRNWLVHIKLAWDILKCTYLHERTCTMHAIVASCPQGQRSQTGAVRNPPALEALLKRSEIIFKTGVRVSRLR